jgi:uncharacterized peroxidase-related enzyme
MSYFLKTVDPDKAEGQLKSTYGTLESMFQMVPKVFIAQGLRPDLLDPIVAYVNRLMIEAHALPRNTKELIAAYVSKLNSCDYCVDAHSAMAMAQGYTQEEVKGIIDDIKGSSLIDEKTKQLLHFSGKITRNAHKVVESDIEGLKNSGCSDEEIFEAVAVSSFFNYINRMADALGAPVEGLQEMMAQMQKT